MLAIGEGRTHQCPLVRRRCRLGKRVSLQYGLLQGSHVGAINRIDFVRGEFFELVLVLAGRELGHGHVRGVRHCLGGHLIQHQPEDPEHVENLVLDVDRVHPVNRSDRAELCAQAMVLLFQHVRHRCQSHQAVVDRLIGIRIVASALRAKRHLHQRTAWPDVLVGRILEASKRDLREVVDEEHGDSFRPESRLHAARIGILRSNPEFVLHIHKDNANSTGICTVINTPTFGDQINNLLLQCSFSLC